MGDPHTTSLPPKTRGIFKFIIDENTDVSIKQENKIGKTKTYISLEQDKYAAFKEFDNSGQVRIEKGEHNFHTSRLYYVMVENLSEDNQSSFTLTVYQRSTIINIRNGVPLKVTFTGPNEVTKNFALPLPKGNKTLTLQVNPILEVDEDG